MFLDVYFQVDGETEKSPKAILAIEDKKEEDDIEHKKVEDDNGKPETMPALSEPAGRETGEVPADSPVADLLVGVLSNRHSPGSNDCLGH